MSPAPLTCSNERTVSMYSSRSAVGIETPLPTGLAAQKRTRPCLRPLRTPHDLEPSAQPDPLSIRRYARRRPWDPHPFGYTWLYSRVVKTAISIPDATFERATRKAQALGMSRSEFFTRAAARYLDELDAESVTEQIDLALAALDGQDDASRDAVARGRRVLTGEQGDW